MLVLLSAWPIPTVVGEGDVIAEPFLPDNPDERIFLKPISIRNAIRSNKEA
jgi:hypothetical protein